MESPEFEIPEFPIYQDLELFKIEWLIMGAFLFVAVVAWAELLQIVISLVMTGDSDKNPYVTFVYAGIITLITVFSIFLFERVQNNSSK